MSWAGREEAWAAWGDAALTSRNVFSHRVLSGTCPPGPTAGVAHELGEQVVDKAAVGKFAFVCGLPSHAKQPASAVSLLLLPLPSPSFPFILDICWLRCWIVFLSILLPLTWISTWADAISLGAVPYFLSSFWLFLIHLYSFLWRFWPLWGCF